MLRKTQMRTALEIEHAWAEGHLFVGVVAPTGWGKTVLFSYLISRESDYCMALAHRRELVLQMSVKLAANGVRHRIIGPNTLIKKAVQRHMKLYGRSFYDPNSRVVAASAQSINLKDAATLALLKRMKLVIVDEGHHLTKENLWGRVVEALDPSCRGVVPSATFFRSDGKGLGRHADGYVDTLAFADNLRTSIEQGFLVDYKLVLSKPADYIRPADDEVTPSGEFRPAAAVKSVRQSKQLVGDVVGEYLKHAAGKLGLTFAYDIPEARELCQAYRDAGVPAEIVTGESDPDWRDRVFERFERREILQIVNVGIAGEGTDIPGVEVVSMAAPTMSKGWFDQMFGRVLRLFITGAQMAAWDDFTPEQRLSAIAASSKPHGLVIDHCGNVVTHLPPDGPRFHTLDRRDRKSRAKDDGVIPMRMCMGNLPMGFTGCFKPFEKTEHICPFCGCPVPLPEPGQRKTPEQVDGDLFLLDADAVELLRQGKLSAEAFAPNVPFGASAAIVRSAQEKHRERGVALNALKDAMALWAGAERDAGHDDRMIQRRFWHSFGVDVLTAQGLNRAEAEALRSRVQAQLDARQIIQR